MFLDTIHGIIERRILLNFRIEPDALKKVLPEGFRPKLHKGYGIGGVCMIRFQNLRPRGMPAFLGMNSENAAHRIAVEWDDNGTKREGVFIPRRDTNSLFNYALGGRIFPGIFNKSQIESSATGNAYSVKIIRKDGTTEVAFRGEVCESLRAGSLFDTIADAAGFFALGATGYSATRTPGHFHGMDLHCIDSTIVPMRIDESESSFFGDRSRFPAGTVELDSALIMRNIRHEWRSRPDIHWARPGSCCD